MRILLAEPVPSILHACVEFLARLTGIEAAVVRTAEAADDLLRGSRWDLIVAEDALACASGESLLTTARNAVPATGVVVLSDPSVPADRGEPAADGVEYVARPSTAADLLALIKRIIGERRLADENRVLQRQLDRRYSFAELVGASPAMSRIFETIERIRGTSAEILISGDAGTGKELVARTIHANSPRAAARFVPVDCATIPDSLVDAELFGADPASSAPVAMGLVEFASGGTLFLDEVNRLPQAAQARLLRVLQERAVVRAGARGSVPVDVRVIASCAVDPDTEVRRGTFREDLFYRLSVVHIELPALAARRADVPLLAQHFVGKAARDLDRPVPELRPEALEILSAHHWPGNVQQLESVIRRVVALAESPSIGADDLPDEIVTAAGEQQDAQAQGFFAVRQQQIHSFEREYFRDLLARCDGDVTRAAKTAKLPRGTLYRLMKKHGLNAADFRR